MFVLDDAGQYPPSTQGVNWEIRTTGTRYPSLSHKYEAMVRWAEMEFDPDIYVLFDDDDIYLPDHIANHVEVLLHQGQWSHPSSIWSLYTGKPEQEKARGRFHGALAVTKEALRNVGGWLSVMPRGRNPSPDLLPGDCRADFDQRMLAALTKLSPPQHPDQLNGQPRNPTYVYRWGSTQAPHCSGLMKTPDDETWYSRYGNQQVRKLDTFSPLLDAESEAMINLLK